MECSQGGDAARLGQGKRAGAQAGGAVRPPKRGRTRAVEGDGGDGGPEGDESGAVATDAADVGEPELAAGCARATPFQRGAQAAATAGATAEAEERPGLESRGTQLGLMLEEPLPEDGPQQKLPVSYRDYLAARSLLWRFRVGTSGIHGCGVFTRVPISARSVLMEVQPGSHCAPLTVYGNTPEHILYAPCAVCGRACSAVCGRHTGAPVQQGRGRDLLFCCRAGNRGGCNTQRSANLPHGPLASLGPR